MEQSSKRICIRASPQTTINELNDYVLRETFGHMNVKDLVVMADVCSTFRRLARKEFSSRHTEVHLCTDISYFKRGDDSEDEDEEEEEHRDENVLCDVLWGRLYITRSLWIPVLRIFGNVITYLNNEDRHLESHPPPLEAIAKYCSESLLELNLSKAEWTNEMISEWQPLMSRLRGLQLHHCFFRSGADASRMLSFCVKLESLKIDYSNTCYSIVGMDFDRPVELPQITTLDLLDSFFEDHDIESLVVLNPQLKDVQLPCNTLDYGILGAHIPNVEDLSLICDRPDTSDWRTFKHLKCLRIDGELNFPEPLTPLLKAVADAAVPLEKLYIFEVKLSHECIAQIVKLKNLNTIWLENSLGNLSPTDILNIVRNLPKLTELFLTNENPSISENSEIRELDCVVFPEDYSPE